MRLPLAFSLLTLPDGIFCVLSGLPSGFLFWQWQTSVAVDRWLYIFGGEAYPQSGSVQPLSSIFSIDLSRSWTTTNVSANNIAIPGSSSMPTRRPSLWYDTVAQTVYQWGGWSYNDFPYQLWAFVPDGSGGGDISTGVLPAVTGDVVLNPSFGSAFTASEFTFYSIGGVQAPNGSSDGQPQLPLEGLVTFNSQSTIWGNATSTDASVGGLSVWSQMTFLPNFGTAGVLAVLGGIAPPNKTHYDYGSAAGLVDMSNIAIYDIGTSSWFRQNTTGSTPPARWEFCMTGAVNKDNTSYEIFVFAGASDWTFDLDNPDDPDYLDVYVLSLPAFTWFKASAPTQQRRATHFCQVIGQRQMLVIGGHDPSIAAWNTNLDPWPNGLNVFDMTEWKWTAEYASDAASYERAAAIEQHYTDNYQSPAWSDNSLETIFATKTPAVQPTSSPSPSPSPIASSRPSPITHQNHAGAIAGGVVGGLLGLLALIAAAIWFPRRRRLSTTELDTSREIYEKGDGLSHEMEVPPSELAANGPDFGKAQPGVAELDATIQVPSKYAISRKPVG